MSSKTILVYLDGTSSCESVLQYAVRPAAVDSGKVLLVCTEREFEHNIIQASTYLEQLITRLKAQPSRIDNPVEICPVAGSTNPTDHILTTARRFAATDIIVSATLKASLRRTLQKEASVPVIIAYAAGTSPRPLTRAVLVPVDGSQDAEAAVPYAVSLARSANVPLILLAVQPSIQDVLVRCGPLYPYPWVFFPNSTLEAAEAAAAQHMYHYLTNLRREWIRPDWGRVLVRLDQGDVVPGIAEAADNLNVGLIVIAADTHWMGWPWLMPGISGAVAHLAPRPVLVIHSPVMKAGSGWNEKWLRLHVRWQNQPS